MWNRGSRGSLGWVACRVDRSVGLVRRGLSFDSTTRFLTRSLERARERSGRSPHTRREFYLFDRPRVWKREHTIDERQHELFTAADRFCFFPFLFFFRLGTTRF